jgi:hypothetical protein
MLIVDNTIISDDLKTSHFVCDLTKCKGACCVEGDAGAPIDEEEISILEDEITKIKPFMRYEGIEVIEHQGVFDFDNEGHYATPLVNAKECAYVVFDEQGIAMCAIENAWKAGKTKFRKPISCHLYPIRLSRYKDFEAINYHQWHICKPAMDNGKKLRVPLYIFLKVALIRKYGEEYYKQLLKLIEEHKKTEKQ